MSGSVPLSLGKGKKPLLIEDFTGQKRLTTLHVVVMSDFPNDHDELLDLDETPSAEELQNQVKRAQAELLQLR